VRVADGLLVKHWGILVMLLLMQQIGVIPAEYWSSPWGVSGSVSSLVFGD
jgi:hypothetical protein